MSNKKEFTYTLISFLTVLTMLLVALFSEAWTKIKVSAHSSVTDNIGTSGDADSGYGLFTENKSGGTSQTLCKVFAISGILGLVVGFVLHVATQQNVKIGLITMAMGLGLSLVVVFIWKLSKNLNGKNMEIDTGSGGGLIDIGVNIKASTGYSLILQVLGSILGLGLVGYIAKSSYETGNRYGAY